MELQNTFKDVASVLSEKCINPQNHRPYTITMLERALKDIHFSVDPKRTAKQQALAVRLAAHGMRLADMLPSALAELIRGVL